MGVLILILGAISGSWSLKNILYCAEKVEAHSYSTMVRKIVGKGWDRAIQVLIFVSISGTCISEQILMCSLAQNLLFDLGYKESFIYSQEMTIGLYYITGMLILFPLALIRHMSGLRYISMFTMFALAYILIALLIELPGYFN